MNFHVLIPARHAATRLPGKPLLDIAGRPMIAHVYERALASGARNVVIATDSEQIRAAAQALGLAVAMTSAEHASGTDRIAEVARSKAWPPDDIVVNVQGDEPLIPPAIIQQVAALLEASPRAAVATLATPIATLAEYLDPNVVKVALALTGRALYFSRAPIPWNRDAALAGWGSQTSHDGALRHIGIYAYRVQALLRIAGLVPTPLEQRERLEQLRVLENDLDIVVGIASAVPPAGVDTPADLERVRQVLLARAAVPG
jgi:3-deoxy-manno-octulosonate cytidylyltransferase (CMP-KDO synthetase)